HDDVFVQCSEYWIASSQFEDGSCSSCADSQIASVRTQCHRAKFPEPVKRTQFAAARNFDDVRRALVPDREVPAVAAERQRLYAAVIVAPDNLLASHRSDDAHRIRASQSQIAAIRTQRHRGRRLETDVHWDLVTCQLEHGGTACERYQTSVTTERDAARRAAFVQVQHDVARQRVHTRHFGAAAYGDGRSVRTQGGDMRDA